MGYQPPAAAGCDYAGQHAQPAYADWLDRVGAYLIDDLVSLVPRSPTRSSAPSW